MDHLPRPRDSDPPAIEVPVLCFDSTFCYVYDDLEFTTFPERCGFSRESLLQPNAESLATQEWLKTLSMLQAWLYFGLLRVIFKEALRVEDFVKQGMGGLIVDSSKLPAYIDEERAQLQRLSKYEQETKKTQHGRLIDLAEQYCLLFETGLHSPQMRNKPSPEIWLSIHVLIQSLRSQLAQHCKETSPPGNSIDLPSLLPLLSQCSPEKGWCRHTFYDLCEKVSYITLYYLVCIPRRRSSDHRACMDPNTTSCVAYNVGAEPFSPHLDSGCTCDAVVSQNEGELLEIISQGHIPLVLATADGFGGVKLRYVKAEPTTSYVAISHLWADGLGNQDHNNLQKCRLMNLLSLIQELQFGRRCSRTLKGLLGFRDWLPDERIPKFTGSVKFWLDVYCIPTATDPQRRKLKEDAINSMSAVYGFAERVLILDIELQTLSPSTPPLEILAYKSLCAWRTRYWTWNELSIAQHAICQFSGFSKRWYRERFRRRAYYRSRGRLSSGTGTPYDQILFELENVVAITSSETMSRRKSFISKILYTMFRLPRSSVTRASQLANVWNSLVDKTSSIPDDMYIILGSMLGIKTRDIMRLPSRDRVKLILASYGELPLSLFISSPNSHHLAEVDLRHQDNEMRWLPTNAAERGHLSQAVPFYSAPVIVTTSGLFISSSILKGDNIRLLWLKLPPSYSSLCQRLDVQFDLYGDPSQQIHHRIWIQLLRGPGDTGPSSGHDSVCFLLLPFERGKLYGIGACFAVSGLDDDVLLTYYDCPVRHGVLSKGDAADEVEILGHSGFPGSVRDPLNILITCNVQSWRRLKISTPYRKKQDFPIPVWFIWAWLSLSMAILLARGFYSDHPLELILYLAINMVIYNHVERALTIRSRLLFLESFSKDNDPQRRQCERLSRRLPQLHLSITWASWRSLDVYAGLHLHVLCHKAWHRRHFLPQRVHDIMLRLGRRRAGQYGWELLLQDETATVSENIDQGWKTVESVRAAGVKWETTSTDGLSSLRPIVWVYVLCVAAFVTGILYLLYAP